MEVFGRVGSGPCGNVVAGEIRICRKNHFHRQGHLWQRPVNVGHHVIRILLVDIFLPALFDCVCVGGTLDSDCVCVGGTLDSDCVCVGGTLDSDCVCVGGTLDSDCVCVGGTLDSVKETLEQTVISQRAFAKRNILLQCALTRAKYYYYSVLSPERNIMLQHALTRARVCYRVISSTVTSSGNCQETETCMVRACHTPRQLLQNHPLGPVSYTHLTLPTRRTV